VRERRQGRAVAIILTVIAILALLVFLGQIFAQEEGEEMAAEEEPPPVDEVAPPEMTAEPGMMEEDMMGMEGMPGARGPRGAAGPLKWTEAPMPEELAKTYAEFIRETGLTPALIPDYFLFDAEGNARTATKNQWMQLQRIYGERRAEAVAVTAGRPGYGLAARINREMGVKQKELDAVRYLYEKGLDNFSFKIGYPQVSHSAIRPGATTIPIEVGVLMQVKSGVAQRYPSLVYRKLKPYDNYGEDRQLFHIVDYEGGMWNPKKLWIWNDAVAEWNNLWSQNSISLTLYDVNGDEIVSASQSAGHSGGICAKLVHPDELNYVPMYETIIAPRDHSFEGGRLNLEYARGWYYSFSLSIPMSQLAALDRAEAVLVGAGGVEGSRGQTQAPPPETAGFEAVSTRPYVQAGVERATDTARRGVGMSGYSLGPPVFTPGFQ